MARDESITKVIEDVPAEEPSDRAMEVSVGCIYQLVGIGAFLAGCGVLFAVLGGHRRLLRTFGIGVGTAPEVALLLIGLGILILLRESLETATPEPADDDTKNDGAAKPKPHSGA